MSDPKSVIVLVGAGNVARYLAEEFVRDGTFSLVIVSRSQSWSLESSDVTFHNIKEYSKDAIQTVLDTSNATTLISTLQGADPVWYTTVHEAILFACRDSRACKRLISSEYMGNLRDFWYLPRGNYYARQPFRTILANQSAVKWSLVNQGLFADYFVQPEDGSMSYIRPFPQGWPIDLVRKTIRIVGHGDAPVGWTAARDMAKAVVKLMHYDDWPDHTYVYGEIGTWNEAIRKLENFSGQKFERIRKTEEELREDLLQTSDREKWYTASIDEWSLLGGTAVPYLEATEQRQKYFHDVHFRTLEEVFSDSRQGAL